MKIKIENYDVVKYYQDGICKKSKLLKHFGSACRVLNSDLTISIIPLSWIQKIKKRTHLPFEECIVTKHAIERASERFLVKNHKKWFTEMLNDNNVNERWCDSYRQIVKHGSSNRVFFNHTFGCFFVYEPKNSLILTVWSK